MFDDVHPKLVAVIKRHIAGLGPRPEPTLPRFDPDGERLRKRQEWDAQAAGVYDAFIHEVADLACADAFFRGVLQETVRKPATYTLEEADESDGMAAACFDEPTAADVKTFLRGLPAYVKGDWAERTQRDCEELDEADADDQAQPAGRDRQGGA